MKKLITVLVVVVVVLVVFLLLGPFYILDEGYQSVVTRFGQIVDHQTTAGLKVKVPMVDTVVKYPKKLLAWDGESQLIPTSQNQLIWVDTTARWRISDPVKFYSSVNSLEQAYGRLDDVIDSAVRTVIAQNPLPEAVRNSNYIRETQAGPPVAPTPVPAATPAAGAAEGAAAAGAAGSPGDQSQALTDVLQFIQVNANYDVVNKGRLELSDAMLKASQTVTPEYGIEIIDIIIRQIRYSDQLTPSVYNRMVSERNQIAQAYRSYGEGKKQEILGQLDNEKQKILSAAYAQSEEIKGEADAEAARIYSDSYKQDPDFFQFWRSIESYKQTLGKFNKTLSTDMDYFKYMYTPSPR